MSSQNNQSGNLTDVESGDSFKASDKVDENRQTTTQSVAATTTPTTTEPVEDKTTAATEEPSPPAR